jgi:hypothetical protein
MNPMAQTETEKIDEARRRLARAGIYAVPAILSVVVVRSAGAQVTCNPVQMGNMNIMNAMNAMGNMSDL